MPKKKLSESLAKDSNFVVIAELAAGPRFNFAPIERFLSAAKEAESDALPKDFDFVGIAIPQSPGGVANLEPSDVLARINDKNLLGDLDFIPHISCKDHNVDAISSSLVNYRARQIQSVLALTGDKPVSAKGSFEIETVGLLQLIERMNCESYLKAKPDQWDKVSQFFPGAAVSPFKYTEASQMQQYYKMEKKIACGTRFLITQIGFDWKKSQELMRYLEENSIDIPVLGNVYLLSTATPAPRLMHDIKLPGCFVSDEFLAKLQKEQVEQHIERAAQQVAMYKQLGTAGVDIGGVHDYATFTKILELANQIGSDWEKYKDNLCWPGGEKFYLYESSGQKAVTARKKKKFRQRFFDFMHRAILDSDYTGFKLFRGTMGLLGTRKGKGFCYKSFYAIERGFKYLSFDCQDCGDCYLHENFGYCSIGGCEKGLDNAPCGDSTVDGLCGNNLEQTCIGDLIYKAAAAKPDGRSKLRHIINQPRMHALENTASILNYLFGTDHTQAAPLISIGDMLDASNPVTCTAMKQFSDSLGKTKSQNGVLSFLKALIQTQAAEGASYIAVNIDALAQDDPSTAAELIRPYVKLVRQLGKGVPVCIESRHEEALIAGLKEWYDTEGQVPPPLVGPIEISSGDKILALRKQYEFGMISTLSNNDASAGEYHQSCIDKTFDMAKQLINKAVNEYHFKPDQIFFDTVAAALMSDMPDSSGIANHTYKAFRIIKNIKRNPATKKSHCLLKINQAIDGIPSRTVGVARAYVAKAMEYGLDAAFVDVTCHYGESPADPKLLQLIDAYAEMDGSPGKRQNAEKLMSGFCSGAKKPVKKS
ncbi:MAG: methylenetetrahydrofolate reductase C-terminal domain-containing protein [Sedimentisphaerales bacterium]